tara:strand:+ start:2150 stop:4054 length:1905 start_codon:yes stop_codon:yes gene_type:complete
MIDLLNAVAIDTETFLIAPGRVAPPLVCLTTCKTSSDPTLDDYDLGIYDKNQAYSIFNDYLHSDITIVGQNIQFDMAVMGSAFPDLLLPIFTKYEKNEVFCTKIRELLWKITTGEYKSDRDAKNLKLSLSDLVNKYLRENVKGKKGDSWRFKYRQLVDTPLEDWPRDALDYAINDAWYTLRVARTQNKVLPDQENQTRYAFALQLMRCWGVRTDPKKVNELEDRLRKRINRANKILLAKGLKRPNKDKYSKNLKEIRALIEKQSKTYGIQAKKTPKGAYSTSKEALSYMPCIGKPCNPEMDYWCSNPLHVLKEISEDEGEFTKYLGFLRSGTLEVINPRISSCKSTGRTSFSKPPLQQMPRRSGVRECFIPRKGYYFIGADYSANELVTLAQVWLDMFGTSQLAELINDGIDPHLYVASLLLDIPYEVAVDKKKDKEVKEFRQLSKALNFGLPGGLGAFTFVGYARGTWGVSISEQQAKEYKAKWLSWFPEARDYFNYVGDCVSNGSFTLEQPRSYRLRGNVGFCDGCNSPFQGLASDMVKDALWNITKECYTDKSSVLYGTRPILLMHDEIIAESPIPLAAEAAERLSELMLISANKWCPDVKSKASPWMTDRWYKEADTVRDALGNLVLWQP